MTRNRIRTALLTGTAFATALGLAASAYAQANESAELETVVVTAQKHSELLSKAAIAVSALSQSSLDKQNIISAKDLAATVPGLQATGSQFVIRGIGNLGTSAYATVAVQIDGAYDPNGGALANALYDLSRIEVARGPQGTVYGRNATAGVINIITADPTDQFQASGDVAVGNYSDITARALVNVPVNDHIALRAFVVREKNDGYFDGGAASRNYSATDLLTGQVSALVKITNSLQWRIAVSHSENTGTPGRGGVASYYYYPNANLATGYTGDPVLVKPSRDDLYQVVKQKENSLSTQENSFRSRLTWAPTDEMTFTYIASYATYVDNGYDAAGYVFNSRSRGGMNRSMVHELDFNYENKSLTLVAGLYYYWQNATGNSALNIGNTLPWPFNTVVDKIYPTLNDHSGYEPSAYGLIDVAMHTAKNDSLSRAAFTQGTYKVTDDLRVTLGVRYTKDTAAIAQYQHVCAFGTTLTPAADMPCTQPLAPVAFNAQSTKSDNTSWKGTIDYDLAPDQLMYATVSTGYRGGGMSGDVSLPKEYLSYRPEKVINYELGWKGQFLENRLGLNLALFSMQYKDMQVYAIEHNLLGNPTPVTVNAASARVSGAELEGMWRLTSADTISGYATYLDAHVSRFPNGVNASINPDGIYNSIAPIFGLPGLPTNVQVDFSHKRLPNAPRQTFKISYAHVFDFGSDGTLTPDVSLYWQSKTYPDLANSERAATGAYTKSDFNLTYMTATSGLAVTFYAHNLENRLRWQGANPQFASVMASYSTPRTYGIRVGYHYN